MAWLQNLAGHAENLLNKIDQNAATVLSDGNKQNTEDKEQGRGDIYDESDIEQGTNVSAFHKLSRSATPEAVQVLRDEKSTNVFVAISETQNSDTNINDTADAYKSGELLKRHHSSSASPNTIQDSFLVAQELEALQSKVARLKLENHDINKQLLNIQHLYSEMRNENTNLQFQVERLQEQLSATHKEKEQYVARAQRILQEKEKLITLNQASNGNDDKSTSPDSSIFTTYNEELQKELEFHRAKVADLSEKNAKLMSDLQSLQMQHQAIQQRLSQSNKSLEKSLLNEKKMRLMAEEDCTQKVKELQMISQEVADFKDLIRHSNEENIKLKEALSRKPELGDSDEFENRMRSLTQTLMLKQNKLETITTERNALKLQYEKLEGEYKQKISELKRDRVKTINVQEANDDRISLPNFMRVSPHDAGVTRRVKRAYSSLDAISARTGVFLRRYPLARVFVFTYVVILHLWVIMVLLWYVPTN